MNNYSGFNVPIVFFIFQRPEKSLMIIERIKVIKPKKIYLLSDYGRNDEEISRVILCRKLVEEAIDWDCQIVKRYADENIGVYENIGLGSMWVLQREKWAIFLEDDNLPELTFFKYCEELLLKYEKNERILWICGTNYLEEFESKNLESYFFTQLMLPCGWASWSDKFLKFYDYNLSFAEETSNLTSMKKRYNSEIQYYNYISGIYRERDRKHSRMRFSSWDYHMELTIKANDLYGICPYRNQIKNIGVDEYSTHGGTSLRNPNTDTHTSMNSIPLEFPLIHPSNIEKNNEFEDKMDRYLIKRNMKVIFRLMNYRLKKILGLHPHESTFTIFRKGQKRRRK